MKKLLAVSLWAALFLVGAINGWRVAVKPLYNGVFAVVYFKGN